MSGSRGRPRLAAALLRWMEGSQWISATGVLVMAFGTDSFLRRLHFIANSSPEVQERGEAAQSHDSAFRCGLATVSSAVSANNTDSKAGYEPLVVLLRESMQRATFAEELEMSMEHIVTKLNWASTQLSKAVECSLASRRQD